MGENSAIGWTDHTFNPWMGCTKVSPACDNCYAEALGKRTGKVQWGDDAVRVVTSPGYWRNPIKWNATAEQHGVRHRVFCASLADVFEDRPELDEPRSRLWDTICATPSLDWLLLTKRPENVLRMAADFVADPTQPADWPLNVWIGTTVEDQERANERVPALLEIPSSVRFLSVEPLLGPVSIVEWLHDSTCVIEAEPGAGCTCSEPYERRVDWVIVGGESGPGYRPLNLDHARSIRWQCHDAGVPFFFKQIGGRFPHSGGDQLDGETFKQFPIPVGTLA